MQLANGLGLFYSSYSPRMDWVYSTAHAAREWIGSILQFIQPANGSGLFYSSYRPRKDRVYSTAHTARVGRVDEQCVCSAFNWDSAAVHQAHVGPTWHLWMYIWHYEVTGVYERTWSVCLRLSGLMRISPWCTGYLGLVPHTSTWDSEVTWPSGAKT